MMRLAILNPLIPRTPKVGCETSEKKQFSESNFFSKKSVFQTSSKIIARPKYAGKWEKLMETCRKLTNIEEYH
jgi:hypothetical protein